MKSKISIVLCKSDFTSYALDLGIWEGLTEGLNNPEQVTVRLVGVEK